MSQRVPYRGVVRFEAQCDRQRQLPQACREAETLLGEDHRSREYQIALSGRGCRQYGLRVRELQSSP